MDRIKQPASMMISESYIIGFDLSLHDDPVLTVVTQNGNQFKYVNILIGNEAIDVYEKITNTKIKENKNEKISINQI